MPAGGIAKRAEAILDAPLLSRAGAIYTLVSLSSTVLGVVRSTSSITVLSIALIVVGVALLVVRLIPRHETTVAPATVGPIVPKRNPYQRAAELEHQYRLQKTVEGEIARIIKDGEAVRGDAFAAEPQWDRYVSWKEPAVEFLDASLGPSAADRLARIESAGSTSDLVSNCLKALREILDSIEDFTVRADEAELADAIEKRKSAPDSAFAAALNAEPKSVFSFDRAIIPRADQQIDLPNGRRELGRVIRVPVTSSEAAAKVHARLEFLPGSQPTEYAPPEAQGQWYSEQGAVEVEIDLPANGRPRLLDVCLILRGDYPHIFEWTVHSVAANLAGYGVKAQPVEIDITVRGEGGAGSHTGRLRVLAQKQGNFGEIRADWISGGPTENEIGTTSERWNF